MSVHDDVGAVGLAGEPAGGHTREAYHTTVETVHGF